jgi:NADPH2:quinone reductase
MERSLREGYLMRAYQMTLANTPPALVQIDRPNPGPGEVRVKIGACGVNFADLLMVDGTYQDCPALPFTLGMELAGTVDALGDGVSTPKIGSRVAIFVGSGGMADYGVFAADRCFLLPDSINLIEAAAFQIAYGTSHLALTHRARLCAGETLLVLGAAGGVGLTAVEIGKLLGARVIAVARGAERLKVAQAAGADIMLDSETVDIRAACNDLGGVDVVYDAVGDPAATAALRTLKPEGRFLSIGFASGTVPKFAANHLLVKNISVHGFYWGGYAKFAPKVLANSLAILLEWHAQGKLHPHISHILPLERAAEALELLRSRRSTGKVAIAISDDR